MIKSLFVFCIILMSCLVSIAHADPTSDDAAPCKKYAAVHRSPEEASERSEIRSKFLEAMNTFSSIIIGKRSSFSVEQSEDSIFTQKIQALENLHRLLLSYGKFSPRGPTVDCFDTVTRKDLADEYLLAIETDLIKIPHDRRGAADYCNEYHFGKEPPSINAAPPVRFADQLFSGLCLHAAYSKK